MNWIINMAKTTIVDFEQMLSNDECAAAIGRNLGNNLRLRRDDHCTDRWSTNWGSKTNAGLARIIFHQMLESGDEYERNATTRQRLIDAAQEAADSGE